MKCYRLVTIENGMFTEMFVFASNEIMAIQKGVDLFNKQEFHDEPIKLTAEQLNFAVKHYSILDNMENTKYFDVAKILFKEGYIFDGIYYEPNEDDCDNYGLCDLDCPESGELKECNKFIAVNSIEHFEKHFEGEMQHDTINADLIISEYYADC